MSLNDIVASAGSLAKVKTTKGRLKTYKKELEAGEENTRQKQALAVAATIAALSKLLGLWFYNKEKEPIQNTEQPKLPSETFIGFTNEKPKENVNMFYSSPYPGDVSNKDIPKQTDPQREFYPHTFKNIQDKTRTTPKIEPVAIEEHGKPFPTPKPKPIIEPTLPPLSATTPVQNPIIAKKQTPIIGQKPAPKLTLIGIDKPTGGQNSVSVKDNRQPLPVSDRLSELMEFEKNLASPKQNALPERVSQELLPLVKPMTKKEPQSVPVPNPIPKSVPEKIPVYIPKALRDSEPVSPVRAIQVFSDYPKQKEVSVPDKRNVTVEADRLNSLMGMESNARLKAPSSNPATVLVPSDLPIYKKQQVKEKPPIPEELPQPKPIPVRNPIYLTKSDYPTQKEVSAKSNVTIAEELDKLMKYPTTAKDFNLKEIPSRTEQKTVIPFNEPLKGVKNIVEKNTLGDVIEQNEKITPMDSLYEIANATKKESPKVASVITNKTLDVNPNQSQPYFNAVGDVIEQNEKITPPYFNAAKGIVDKTNRKALEKTEEKTEEEKLQNGQTESKIEFDKIGIPSEIKSKEDLYKYLGNVVSIANERILKKIRESEGTMEKEKLQNEQMKSKIVFDPLLDTIKPKDYIVLANSKISPELNKSTPDLLSAKSSNKTAYPSYSATPLHELTQLSEDTPGKRKTPQLFLGDKPEYPIPGDRFLPENGANGRTSIYYDDGKNKGWYVEKENWTNEDRMQWTAWKKLKETIEDKYRKLPNTQSIDVVDMNKAVKDRLENLKKETDAKTNVKNDTLIGIIRKAPVSGSEEEKYEKKLKITMGLANTVSQKEALLNAVIGELGDAPEALLADVLSVNPNYTYIGTLPSATGNKSNRGLMNAINPGALPRFQQRQLNAMEYNAIIQNYIRATQRELVESIK